MGLSTILCLMISISAVFSVTSGRANAFAFAFLDGPAKAVELLFGIVGPLSLWCGLSALAETLGLFRGLGRLLRPVLIHIFPSCKKNGKLEEMLSANLCMNLIGLGNAATPMGVRAMKLLSGPSERTRATAEMCRLAVLNSASVQLIPTTVTAIRAQSGASFPFDILPCVWLTSLCSVGAGLAASYLMERP